MFNMRSDIGIRRSAKGSRLGDVFSSFEMYIGKEPRGLGSDDGICGRGWQERQIFHGGWSAVVSSGRIDMTSAE